MSSSTLIDLSRLQFAVTAMYHFLFVPFTLGLSLLVAIMESIYVMTGRAIWRDMTRFWGILFGINFAMGVATGITMEFQFGTNWAYYSHYVGDIFGVPLAIEGLMAFFLEGTFIGLFFFGWDRSEPPPASGRHMAGGDRQQPVGAVDSDRQCLDAESHRGAFQFHHHAHGTRFDPRRDLQSRGAVQVRAHRERRIRDRRDVRAGDQRVVYAQRRHIEFAKRSATVAISFGLASALSVVVLGDESGYNLTEHQKMKIAAMESEWHTEPAPAPFTLFGLPDVANHGTHAQIQMPWLLGLIATRSLDTQVPGIYELVDQAKQRIINGIPASDALRVLRENPDEAARQTLKAHAQDLGYALLLRKYVSRSRSGDAGANRQAAWDTVPSVGPMFWTFRVMVGLGFFFIGLFCFGFYLAARRRIAESQGVPENRSLDFAAAVVRGGTGVVHRRAWPPTLGDRGRAADVSGGVAHSRIECSIESRGFVVFYTVLAVIDVFLLRNTSNWARQRWVRDSGD